VIDRNVTITADMEVPEVVAKEARKKNPDSHEYETKMKNFGNNVEDLKNKRRHIIQKKREFLEGGTIGNSKVTFRDYITEKLDLLKKVKD
jgi:hypothetical protein